MYVYMNTVLFHYKRNKCSYFTKTGGIMLCFLVLFGIFAIKEEID